MSQTQTLYSQNQITKQPPAQMKIWTLVLHCLYHHYNNQKSHLGTFFKDDLFWVHPPPSPSAPRQEANLSRHEPGGIIIII